MVITVSVKYRYCVHYQLKVIENRYHESNLVVTGMLLLTKEMYWVIEWDDVPSYTYPIDRRIFDVSNVKIFNRNNVL